MVGAKILGYLDIVKKRERKEIKASTSKKYNEKRKKEINKSS